MENYKYHIATLLSMIIFSFASAKTINKFIEYSFITTEKSPVVKSRPIGSSSSTQYVDIQKIFDSGFFKLGDVVAAGDNGEIAPPPPSTISDLTLLGTLVTGYTKYDIAMIKKSGEKEAKICKMWTDVYGYKLIRVSDTTATLRSADKKDTYVLDMNEKKEKDGSGPGNFSSGKQNKIKKSISRAKMKQDFGDLNTLSKGIVFSTPRKDGKITGFKIKKIRSSHALYKLGVRNGDIIKRINGHPVDDMKKLLGMWEGLPQENSIKVDVKRGNDDVSYDFTITD